jgi:hypothetical protein
LWFVFELPTATAGRSPTPIATADVHPNARRFNIRTPFLSGFLAKPFMFYTSFRLSWR